MYSSWCANTNNKKFTTLKNQIKCTSEETYLKKLSTELEKQFNVNQVDEFGNTLLHYACRERKYSIINMLLAHSADVTISNNDGRLPIHIAAIYGSMREIKNIIHSETPINDIVKSSNSIFSRLLTEFPESISVVDHHNNTPLYYFTIHSDLSDIKILKNIGYMIKFSTMNSDDIVHMVKTYIHLKKNKKKLTLKHYIYEAYIP